ncbi:hypothetical protein PNIG_a1044 [Pseudoalteromonas nigrifaciens]|uniref:Orphan protein n=2 Tax=Pseudoalteromonas TaxID=53246 RepID=Q3IE47_PSET1|nr:hypothetical protein PNIG_a1044 [Pseudoalteromonas nigrifaciens]CAI85948.1 putative orphan protein [Pseudoalteromonas translucida]SJN21553.1 putative orphan protein [Pseudoalteromonas sp. JB197]
MHHNIGSVNSLWILIINLKVTDNKKPAGAGFFILPGKSYK